MVRTTCSGDSARRVKALFIWLTIGAGDRDRPISTLTPISQDQRALPL